MIAATIDGENMQILALVIALTAAAFVYVVRRGKSIRSAESKTLTTEVATARPTKEPELRDLSTIAEKINLPLTIRYRDRHAVETERPVTAMKVVGWIDGKGIPHPVKFYAFCEKRNDVRSFLFERVLDATDGETGEVVNDLATHLIRSAPAAAMAAH